MILRKKKLLFLLIKVKSVTVGKFDRFDGKIIIRIFFLNLDSGFGVLAAINLVTVGGANWTVILAQNGILSFLKFESVEDYEVICQGRDRNRENVKQNTGGGYNTGMSCGYNTGIRCGYNIKYLKNLCGNDFYKTEHSKIFRILQRSFLRKCLL